jgi:hypothetical protein
VRAGGNYGNLPDDYNLTVKGMALVGTLVGQVGVGNCCSFVRRGDGCRRPPPSCQAGWFAQARTEPAAVL